MMTSIEIILQPSYITQGYINIGKKWWDLFPAFTKDLELEAKPTGVIHTQFYVEKRGNHHGFSRDLRPWFKAHPELKAESKVRIATIEPMKKYGLEIVK